MLTSTTFLFRSKRCFLCIYQKYSKQISGVSIYHHKILTNNCQKCFSTLCQCRKIANKDLTQVNLTLNILRRSYGFTSVCHKNSEDKLEKTTQSHGMDEDELKEEQNFKNHAEYVKYNAQRDELFSYLHIGDIDNAIKTLLSYKANTHRILYNVILRRLAFLGELDLCFKIYHNMRKLGMQPNAATYTSLLNACAECTASVKAVEKLKFLRQMFRENQICLNQIHYNVMIKACGIHKMFLQCFQLLDEMYEHNIKVGPDAYRSLLRAASEDKKRGLKIALTVWHLMRHNKMKPNVIHYVYLFKAMRHSNFGSLDESFLKSNESSKIIYSECEPPNLLKTPPILSALLLPIINRQKGEKADRQTENEVAITAISNISVILNNIDMVHESNRLILFGGISGVMDSMKNDGVRPNIKSLTLLVDLIQLTDLEEEKIYDYMRSENIQPDVLFFNACIWNYISQFQYDKALKTVNKMQRMNVPPNIHTLETLARTCGNTSAAETFLRQLSSLGYASNSNILNILLKQAIVNIDAEYIIFLFHYMKRMGTKLNDNMMTQISDFVTQLRENQVHVRSKARKMMELTDIERKKLLKTLQKFFSESRDITFKEE